MNSVTDKEKIRKKVEIVISRRLNLLNGDYFDLNKEVDGFTNEIMDIIDSMQEESASRVWHNSNEEQPNFASDVAIWNPKYKNGEIISRCTKVYSDRIWAYIDDLLKM